MKNQTYKAIKKLTSTYSLVIAVLAVYTINLTSCKETDALLGTPVNVEITTPPDQDGEGVTIDYRNPIVLDVGDYISGIAPVITGNILPEVTPNYVTTLYGDDVYGSTNGPLTSDVRFAYPLGFVVDNDGVIYVSEDGRNYIRKIAPTGDIRVTVFAGASNGAEGIIDGVGNEARFKVPLDITLHPITGDIYVVDEHRVRRVTKDADVTTFAGSLTNTVGFTNGTPAETTFDDVTGIAIAPNGDMYFADRDNHAIRKYIAAENRFITFAGGGTGVVGASGYLDAQGTNARFKSPVRVALDKDGNVIVVDRSNYCIRKITPDGTVTTIAGSTTRGYKPGNGTSAGFQDPFGIAIDPSNGDIYIGDYAGNRIRKIVANGDVLDVIGDGTAGFVDGVASIAKIDQASGMMFAPNGMLHWISRRGSLRTLITKGFDISPALPAGLVLDPYTGIISGTPTEAKPQTVYKVTAYNGRGEIVATTDIILTTK
jgi:hypothetical protein